MVHYMTRVYDTEAIIAQYLAGASCKEIAPARGMSANQVRNILKKARDAGRDIPCRWAPGKYHPPLAKKDNKP